jgi:hypothetical protein
MKKLKDHLNKEKIKEHFDLLKNKAQPFANQANQKTQELWLAGTMMMGDWSQYLSDTDLVRNLNQYKSELSKAMDGGFDIGSLDLETGIKMSPNNHRILDGGHGFFESIQKAKEVGGEQGWSDTETFTTWFQSYFTDLSSPAGMPAFGDATDNMYAFLRNFLSLDEATARDLVTVNGQEAIEAILGGTLAGVSLFFAWKKQDKENFSKAIGSIGLGAAVSMNPAVLCIIVVAAALGYNTLVCKKAIQRGGIVSFVAMGTSALLPGPVLLGLIPGVVLAMYVNKKMGKDFEPSVFMKELFLKMGDAGERQRVMESISGVLGKYQKKVAA